MLREHMGTAKSLHADAYQTIAAARGVAPRSDAWQQQQRSYTHDEVRTHWHVHTFCGTAFALAKGDLYICSSASAPARQY